ncbi:MAG TPA: PIN domain-containing protein [Caulifigura sp.]|jgi:tRNA(fMet)-specific endonuclease VapC|nr:PIN domain-containing protein [Caulifigura sp.]
MSEFVLLDTDVLSYSFKNSRHAERFRPLLANRRAAVAFATVAEVYLWAKQRNWATAKVQLLEQMLRGCVVVPYSSELAWKWAEVRHVCDRAGRSISGMDAWIAATALHRQIPLVTNNTSDFTAAEEHCGLQILRPGN